MSHTRTRVLLGMALLSSGVVVGLQAGVDGGRSAIEAESSVRLRDFSRAMLFGKVEAQADVMGSVARVSFSVDGVVQATVERAPFKARVSLPPLPEPVELVAEAFDDQGRSLGRDRRLLNAGHGVFRLRVRSPAELVRGENRIVLDIDVPATEPPPTVEISLEGQVLATIDQPPYVARVSIPAKSRGDASAATPSPILEVRAVRSNGERLESALVVGSDQVVGFRQAVSLVELFVVAQSRRGLFISDLEREEMTLREDSQEIPIRRFDPAQDVPLTVVLALDVSSSMSDELEKVRLAARHFIENLRPLDRALLVAFSDEPELLTPASNDPSELDQALERLLEGEFERGGTAIWDALVYSLVQLGGIRGRKAVVLLTDGEDQRSRFVLHQADRFVKRIGVPVYMIDLDSIDLASQSARRRHEVLRIRKMVEESGGRLIQVEGDADLEQVYLGIADELRQQYLLSYVSTSEPGWRPIELSVERQGVIIRTARGRWQR